MLEINKITKISFLMILLILSIGAVSAADISADNMTADTDVDLMLDDSPARVSSVNVNANNYADLKDYCKKTDVNYVINLTGSSNTVEIQNGTYLFENNVFINSVQNIPQQNTAGNIPLLMASAALVTSNEDSEDTPTVIYQKNGTYNSIYYHEGENLILIGESRDGVIFKEMEINPDGQTGKFGNYTFINMTIKENGKYPLELPLNSNVKFINCTFINVFFNLNSDIAFQFNVEYKSFGNGVSNIGPYDFQNASYSFINCHFYFENGTDQPEVWSGNPAYYGDSIKAVIFSDCLATLNIIDCTFENIVSADDIIYMMLIQRRGDERINIVNPTIIDCTYNTFVNAEIPGLDSDDNGVVSITYKPKLNVTVGDSKIGEPNPVVITLPADATGNVTVTINGKTYKGKVSNGAATINADPLDYGNYAAHVDYSGDDKYTPATKVANFAVGFNNYLTNDTFFSYFNQDGTLKEEYGYNNLTFNGIFSNLGVETVTINKPITIYGKETVLNNIGLVIDSDNVLVKNFTFNINDLESAIEIISKNNVTLVNNTINFNATADKDGYGIYASSVENMTVANNTINYIGATEENGPVNAIIFIENGKNISMTGNNISATLDSVPVSYEPLPPWTATIFSQGVYMSGTDINVENNDLKVKTGESSGAYDTIYGFILNADNASFANNNITAEGNSYIYGLTISGKNSNVTQNNINVTTPGKYAGGIQINSPYAGTVSENNVTIKSKDVAYGIFTYGDVNATIKENNVDIASSTLYAIEVIGNNETVIENNITAKGNYTIGIASSTNGPVTIKDNQIKVDGEGLGEPTTGDLIKPTNAGILVTNYPTSATITGNTIIANIPAKPMGNLTAGMKLASSNTLVENNTITVTPTAGSGYDSIYGLSSTGNDVTIKNNTITVEGDKAPYEYGVSVSGDDVNIDSNKITVNNDKNYADGIQVNTGFSGTVANNEVNVKGNQSAYGIISSAWGSTTVEATYDNNNVTVDGQTAYGLQLLGTEENATNNNVAVTGEYTMGITTNTPIIEIKDNNVTAEGTGKTSLPTYDMFGATNQGILIYNNATKATITGNNVTTTGEYAVNVLKTENSVSTVKDNYLVAEKLTGNDAINNITGEIENNTPIKDILVSQDLVKYYKNGTQYTVTVLNNKVPVANKKVTVVLNGPSFKNLQYTIVTNSEGVATLPINLAPGQYTINAFTDNSEEIENTITVLPQSYSLEAEDIDMFVKDGTKYEVTLTDASGSPVANTKVTLTLNGKSFKNLKYDRITDANGVASLPINLAVGQYAITATYGSESITTNVNVLPKESALIAENVVKYYKNGTQYNVKLLDENGKPAAGKTITVTLNGASFKNLKYNIVTNNDGVATLNIGLAPGAYTITANYGEMSTTNTINVLPTLTTEDLTKAVNKPASFTAKLVDQQGKPMANAKVSFTITGKTIKTVTYTKVTDANGIASLPINLAQGDYTITVSDNSGAKAAGNVKVTKATA
ncbi:Ig-like domain repeat protein [Methanobrevibacter sp.]|uniref:right-handed parallel beta-helix repeat-containing protein n=1 Tax=Methanobrevibacter sp. TaxID=66852 RepID=UPI0026DFDC2C|nr:Ig-like domain repeat protein [Methanobrevibacter sp.]